jgi:hypothetical protein
VLVAAGVVGAAAGVAAAGLAVAGAAATGVVAAAATVGVGVAVGFAAAATVGFAAAALAAGAGVGVAAFPLAAGVCARARGATEINPANAVNQKALLRRITTLSTLRIAKKVPGFPDTKKRRTDGAPSSSGASSSDAAFPPSRIFESLSRAHEPGGCSPPWTENPSRSGRPRVGSFCGERVVCGPALQPALCPRVDPWTRPANCSVNFAQGRPGPRTGAKNRCVLRKTAAERYGSGTGTDRRSNAALGRTSWATAQASDGGLIPSNERAAVRRRE